MTEVQRALKQKIKEIQKVKKESETVKKATDKETMEMKEVHRALEKKQKGNKEGNESNWSSIAARTGGRTQAQESKIEMQEVQIELKEGRKEMER